MALNAIFRGTVKGDKIVFQDARAFKALISSLEGKQIDFIVRRYHPARSTQQNRYYWAVVVGLIAEHCGYEPEEAHDALRMRFLQKPEAALPTVRSSASLDTKEFTDYIENCRRLGAELGIVIPAPNEVEID